MAKTKKKEYYIDFECWSIEANSEKHAENLALAKLRRGELPRINSVEES